MTVGNQIASRHTQSNKYKFESVEGENTKKTGGGAGKGLREVDNRNVKSKVTSVKQMRIF